MEENELLLGICLTLGAVILVLLIARICLAVQSFIRELNYINSEIDRTKGIEKMHWLKAKRKHWSRFFIYLIKND